MPKILRLKKQKGQPYVRPPLTQETNCSDWNNGNFISEIELPTNREPIFAGFGAKLNRYRLLYSSARSESQVETKQQIKIVRLMQDLVNQADNITTTSINVDAGDFLRKTLAGKKNIFFWGRFKTQANEIRIVRAYATVPYDFLMMQPLFFDSDFRIEVCTGEGTVLLKRNSNLKILTPIQALYFGPLRIESVYDQAILDLKNGMEEFTILEAKFYEAVLFDDRKKTKYIVQTIGSEKKEIFI